jgi:hypothetical protein
VIELDSCVSLSFIDAEIKPTFAEFMQLNKKTVPALFFQHSLFIHIVGLRFYY